MGSAFPAATALLSVEAGPQSMRTTVANGTDFDNNATLNRQTTMDNDRNRRNVQRQCPSANIDTFAIVQPTIIVNYILRIIQ